MKKIKWLVTVLIIASITLGIIGCDNPSGPDNGGTKGAIVPEMVEVKGATVTGAAYTNNYKGVFIEGRTVTLSDFYMGKYEVTQVIVQQIVQATHYLMAMYKKNVL